VRWPWRPDREHDASVAEAEKRLAELEQQQPRVDRLARELEARRRANRFTEAVREALGGR
jgi:hypothetical protein